MILKNIVYKIATFSLFVFFAVVVNAQQFNEKVVQLIDGKTYYLHKIEKGNTLYSLSKMYSVKIKSLLSENPQLEEGLKVDQVIRIPVNKVDTKQALNNPPKAKGKYLIHTVKSKESLYALSRKYDVSTSLLQKFNPELNQGLKDGMQLKIPVIEGVFELKDKNLIQPAVEDSLQTHFVEPKQTLYALSKEYNISVDSILMVNPGLENVLKVGTTVRLPIEKYPSKITTEFVQNQTDSSAIKNEYQIVLMLPFYFDINDTIEMERREYESEKIYKGSEVAMSIYTGLKVALDSLKNKGYGKFKILVYDTKYDRKTRLTETVEGILLDQELYNTDLFIGPLYRPNFELVQQYANAIGVPIITPVPQDNNLLDSNYRTIKINTAVKTQIEFIRSSILKNHKDKNLIIVENNNLKDVLLAEHFKGINNGDTIKEIFNLIDSSFKILKIYDFDTSQIKKILNDTMPNILVIPLNGKSFVTRTLSALNKYSNDYDITVIGLDSWSNFGNIDVAYLNNLKVHIPYNLFIDYNKKSVDNFIKKYRESYFTDPNEWSFLSYDMGLYFFDLLQNIGTSFYNDFLKMDAYKGVAKNFKFSNPKPNAGFENSALKLIKYENYYYVEIE